MLQTRLLGPLVVAAGIAAGEDLEDLAAGGALRHQGARGGDKAGLPGGVAAFFCLARRPWPPVREA